jgi:hypothetical protein
MSSTRSRPAPHEDGAATPANIDVLPLEVLEACLYTAGPEVASTACTTVCQFWRTASSSTGLWDRFLHQRWPNFGKALSDVCQKKLYLLLARHGPSDYHIVDPPHMSNPWSLLSALQIIVEFDACILGESRTFAAVLPLSSAAHGGYSSLRWTELDELKKLKEPEEIARRRATEQGY